MPEFPVSFPKAGGLQIPSTPPILPDSRQHRGAFTNPFSRDASGRNAFERGGEILRDTFRGTQADIKTAGGLLPGETGATGEKTRTGTGFGFDTKSIVVYAVAAVIAVFGLLMLTRVGTTITVAATGGAREGIGYQVRREVSGRGSRARARARRRGEENE